MDEQAQMQAIVDKLVGVPPETLPHFAAFDEPWRTIYLHVRRCGDFEDAEWLLVKVAKRYEQRERRWLIKVLCDMLPSDEGFTAYPSLDEILGPVLRRRLAVALLDPAGHGHPLWGRARRGQIPGRPGPGPPRHPRRALSRRRP